jgi:alkylation response protein AidB-like acyl-CoA dehydrogenase
MALSSEERSDLRTSARALLARASSSDAVRAVVADSPGFDRALWDQMVELGWTSIHVDPEHGGGGAGYADLAVILHELGRAIVPSPFLASAVLTNAALSLADNGLGSELRAALTAGDSTGSVALASTDGSYEPSRLSTEWTRSGAALSLRGSAGFVLDADVADVLVVAARGADDAPAFVAVDTSTPGLRVHPAPTVDATRRLFTVDFDEVAVPEDRLLCEPGGRAGELLAQTVAVGAIAAAADAMAVAERALEGAAEYAKTRMQFGKPIGTFQAVKHHCANMAIAVEASRAAVRAACDALDGDPRCWPTTAAVTASYVGPACAEACGLALRVHGGIGFTWEHDAHLHLKRVKLDEVLFGTPSWHRRRLAGTLIDDEETRNR